MNIMAAKAKSRAAIASERRGRERTLTSGVHSSAHRRRLNTIGRSDGPGESDEEDSYHEPLEHGDDVLNGENATGTSTPMEERSATQEVDKDASDDMDVKPRVADLIGAVPCELTQAALNGVMEYHWDLDDEVQRTSVATGSLHARLTVVESGQPTKIDVYPQRGGSLTAARNALSAALGRGYFRGLVRGLTGWWENPLQLDVVDSNPNITSRVVQMVYEIDKTLNCMIRGHSKVTQQNEQAKTAKSELKKIAEEYAGKFKVGAYYLNFSWPCAVRGEPHADSWSCGITIQEGGTEQILMICEYDHERQRQEFLTDLRVVKSMMWSKADMRRVLDTVITESRMYREDIFWATGDMPLLTVRGKQKHFVPGKGGAGQQQTDDTPPAQKGPPLLQSKGVPPSMAMGGGKPSAQSMPATKGGGKPQFVQQNQQQQNFGQASGAGGKAGKNGPYGAGSTGQFVGGGGYGGFSPRPPAKGTRPGDWICATCGDYQFARNRSCRACGSPQQAPAGFGLSSNFGANSGGQGKSGAGKGTYEFPPRPPMMSTTVHSQPYVEQSPQEWLQPKVEHQLSYSSGDVEWMAAQLRSYGVPLPGQQPHY